MANRHDPLSVERIPPHDMEAEQAVLGSCLIDPEAAIVACDLLSPEDFYRNAHRLIFGAISSLVRGVIPIDLISLPERLRRADKLDEVGGAAYLMELTDVVPTSTHIEHYAKIVREKSQRRKAIEVFTVCLGELCDTTSNTESVLGSAFSHLSNLSLSVASDWLDMEKLHTAAMDVLDDRYHQRRNNPNYIGGAVSNIKRLDYITDGFHPSTLSVVAAATKGGKTAFAIQCAVANARRGMPVAIFSLEMSAQLLYERILSQVLRIDLQKIRKADLSEMDWDRMINEMTPLAESWPIYFAEAGNATSQQIAARARRLHVERKVGLVIVDYLQIVTPTRARQVREQEVASIAKDLKAIAVDLGVAVLTMSQLNDEGQIRESRAIGHTADTVIAINHKGYKGPEPHEVEIEVQLQRQGPPGVVPAWWDPQYQTFSGLEERHDLATPHYAEG